MPPSISNNRVEATRILFHHIGAVSGNREIIAAIDAVSDRLGAVRSIEADAIEGLDHEIEGFTAALSGQPAIIGRAVRAYHRRRLAAVPALLRRLYRAGDR